MISLASFFHENDAATTTLFDMPSDEISINSGLRLRNMFDILNPNASVKNSNTLIL